MRAKSESAEITEKDDVAILEDDTLVRKVCRSRWAAMIQKVFEVDPLVCPKRGGQMRIIAFIERKDQPQVVEGILKCCDLWIEPACGELVESEERVPPEFSPEPEYIPMDEFLANF